MRWVAIVALVAAFSGCTSGNLGGITLLSQTEDAQRRAIAKVLNDLHDGVDGQKIFKIMANVSPAYKDEAGRGRAEVQQTLKDFFAQHRRIRVTRTNPRLQMEGEQAVALESIGLIAEPLRVEQAETNWIGEVKIWLARGTSGNWEVTRVSTLN